MLFSYQPLLKGKSIGIVFGSFCPLHQGHIEMIMRARNENDGGCIVVVCGFEGDKGEPRMPHDKRYKCVKEFFSGDDMISVHSINDTELGIAMYPNGWDKWIEEIRNIWTIAVEDTSAHRVWYVGEPEYKENLNIRGEEAILLDRSINPISGTMIRQDPIKHWDKIAHPFHKLLK